MQGYGQFDRQRQLSSYYPEGRGYNAPPSHYSTTRPAPFPEEQHQPGFGGFEYLILVRPLLPSALLPETENDGYIYRLRSPLDYVLQPRRFFHMVTEFAPFLGQGVAGHLTSHPDLNPALMVTHTMITERNNGRPIKLRICNTTDRVATIQRGQPMVQLCFARVAPVYVRNEAPGDSTWTEGVSQIHLADESEWGEATPQSYYPPPPFQMPWDPRQFQYPHTMVTPARGEGLAVEERNQNRGNQAGGASFTPREAPDPVFPAPLVVELPTRATPEPAEGEDDLGLRSPSPASSMSSESTE